VIWNVVQHLCELLYEEGGCVIGRHQGLDHDVVDDDDVDDDDVDDDVVVVVDDVCC